MWLFSIKEPQAPSGREGLDSEYCEKNGDWLRNFQKKKVQVTKVLDRKLWQVSLKLTQ